MQLTSASIQVKVYNCKLASVSIQVQVSKCKYPSVSMQVQVSKYKYASESLEAIFPKNPSRCFRGKKFYFRGLSPLQKEVHKGSCLTPLLLFLSTPVFSHILNTQWMQHSPCAFKAEFPQWHHASHLIDAILDATNVIRTNPPTPFSRRAGVLMALCLRAGNFRKNIIISYSSARGPLYFGWRARRCGCRALGRAF